MFLFRRVAFPVAFALTLPGFPPPSHAAARNSWLLDPAELHVSVHGRMLTCADCHEDIFKAPLHPDPHKTAAPAPDSARAEMCRLCHAPVYEGLKANRHGQMAQIDPVQFRDCVTCHNPHADAGAQNTGTGRVDPGRSLREQCGACHEPRSALPKRPASEEQCLGCHLLEADGAEAPARISQLCLHCHGDQGGEAQRITVGLAPPIDEAAYRSTVHAGQACTACHTGAAAFGHGGQARVDCGGCHAHAAPHYSRFPDSPHIGVECLACHVAAPKQAASGHAISKAVRREACQRCHAPGNRVGAAAMVLPGKGVLCMPCHVATPTATDATSIGGLSIFLLGVAAAFSVWLTGRFPGRGFAGRAARAAFSRRGVAAIKGLLLDGILQRRLYRQSRVRWAIHAGILLPFLFRFAWGIAGLVAANVWRRSTWYEFLLNVNHPATALLFDLTGLLVLLGAAAAVVRGIVKRSERLPSLPGQDYAALGLIGGVMIVGFALEGMRIAMIGVAWSAPGAFIGYPISRLFAGWQAVPVAYGYVWYLHAILTAAFAAYLPFSRMFHILVAPVSLAIRGAKELS